ncbi:MAG: hypothetical protein GX783_07025 [Clostridiales bacterium]|nr:hypothetical protein [Clostridiales bacterium]
MDKEYLEINLPPYLMEDIHNLEEGIRLNLTNRMDVLYGELKSSINVAFHSDRITEEQAKYLRDKYVN